MIVFYLLVAVLSLVKHPIWSLTRVGDLTMNKYLGIICLLIALIYLAGRTTPLRLLQGWPPKIFVAFALATIASFSIAGSNIAVEISPLSNWVSFLLLFFTAAVLVDTHERLRWTLLALVGGLAFTALHLLREWQAYGVSRPGWVTGDPNYYALSALLVMPLALLLAIRPGLSTFLRLFCGACFLAIFGAFTLAGSRGGLLGMGVGALVLIWRSPNRMRYFGACGALMVLLAVVPVGPVNRLLNPGTGDDRSTEVRKALLGAGIRMFQDNFIAGTGVGRYKALVGLYAGEDERLKNVAHNTYVEVASELGIGGLALFVAILYGGMRQMRKIQRSAPTPLIATAALGIEIGLLSGAIGVVFLSALHVRLLWFMVILAIRLPVVVADMTAPAPVVVPVRNRPIRPAQAQGA